MKSEESDKDINRRECTYMQEKMEVIVLGASGDLAKKKTYPALLDLFAHGFLPDRLTIMGFARTEKTSGEFREYLKKHLQGKAHDNVLEVFISRCYYFSGAYDSASSFTAMNETLGGIARDALGSAECGCDQLNRLFYFAIPPNVFIPVAKCIKDSCTTSTGWNRLIVEKPFGQDLSSAQKMSRELGDLFSEEHIYRIDHYLGKEMVQNLIMFRFGNIFLEPLLNNRYVQNIQITFKEDFGTDGRGGYFDNYGIIRDVMQNHLTQVLSILAMEPPVSVSGPDSGNFVRDAKVAVLRSITPPEPRDVVLGQYVANDKGQPGYLDDPTVPPNSTTPTFAQVILRVNTPRWEGVPFIMKAGKALDEKKAEIRIQFKDAPASSFLFGGQPCPRNELVLRLQPSEAVYFKINVKKPGLSTLPLQSELDLTYVSRYPGTYSPDAYTRLVLEALRGNQATFVRNDELDAAWRIFTPLLNHIDNARKIPRQSPRVTNLRGSEDESSHSAERSRRTNSVHDVVFIHPYVYGTRGPEAATEMIKTVGFRYDQSYSWGYHHKEEVAQTEMPSPRK